MAEVKEALKGDIFWNLPALLYYRVNTELPLTVSAVNLTDTTHEYMLMIKTFDRNGRQITEEVFTVDGLTWFELEEGERIDADGTIVLYETDVTLGIYLIEREEEEEVDRILTWLQGY